jgi:uncharacterized protein YkwD
VVLRARLGRLASGALVTTTVVGLVLVIPVISGVGGGSPAVELDSSSTAAAAREGSSPIVMGLDGRPGGLTSEGTTPSSGAPSATADPRTDSVPGSSAADPSTAESWATDPSAAATTAPGTTGSTPAGTPSSAGTTPPGSPAGSPTSQSPTPGSAPAPSTPVPTTPPPATPAQLPDAAGDVLALLNAERAAAGCGALVLDGGLAAIAQAHSAAMSASGDLDLDDLDVAGAVVAEGRPTAQSAVAGWLADPDDSAVLLDCSRTTAGVAAVDGWWTTVLA